MNSKSEIWTRWLSRQIVRIANLEERTGKHQTKLFFSLLKWSKKVREELNAA